jgi:rhodanese-related sulfurtransferase
MDPRTAADLDDAQYLDVREPYEWATGHIDGATHVPMSQLGARQDEIAQDRKVVVVCRTGSRSAMVTQALQRAGYDADNLDGGLHAWTRSGLQLVADGDVEPRVA